MQMNVRPASGQANERLFDWKLDVERLEREAQRAVQQRRPDPWALAEAECSLDLIDAEIAALRPKGAQGDAVVHSVTQLEGWRARLAQVIRTLGRLGTL